MPDPQKKPTSRTALDVLSDLNTIRKGSMPDGSTVAQRKKRAATTPAPAPQKPEEKSYLRRGIDYLMGWDSSK